LGTGKHLAAARERVTRALSAPDEDLRGAVGKREHQLSAHQVDRLPLSPHGEGIRILVHRLELAQAGELPEPRLRERCDRLEALQGFDRDHGRQKSKTWLFCSMRGRYWPASSSISCIVSSISPGFRCVM